MDNINKVKVVVALIIGYVLSFLSLVLIVKLPFLKLLFLIIFFMGIYDFIKYRFGLLFGILGGGIVSLILTSIIGHWAEATDDAQSMIGAFLLLTPLAVLYAGFLYFADKNKNHQQE